MVGLIFIILALIFLLIGYVFFRQRQCLTCNMIRLKGTIIEIKVYRYTSENKPREQHSPLVKYRYQNKNWHFKTQYDARLYQHQVGTELSVYIHPEHPSLACTDQDIQHKKLMSMIFLSLGMILMISGIWLEIDSIKAIMIGEHSLTGQLMLILFYVFISILIIHKILKKLLATKIDNKDTMLWGLIANAKVFDD